MKDHLSKAIVDGIRVYAAVTTNLVDEAAQRHQCYPTATAALGRTMTGALLLAANLKNKECLTVKFAGDGPLGRVVADASSDGFVRGYVEQAQADLPLHEGKLAVGAGVGQGLVSVTRFTGLKEPITGSCEIVTGEIAEDLTRYLYVSEQTPSSIGLGVLVDKELKATAAGGFFIQPLPDVADSALDQLEENLKRIRPVSAMVKDGLDANGIIGELFAGRDINYLETVDLAFKCQCSKRRLEEVLLSLGEADLRSLLDDGQAEVTCQFCSEKYCFSREELAALLQVSLKLSEKKE